jgi:hypothetical protein
LKKIKKKVMREDFKYPCRVITRQEEIEGSQAVGFIVGLILFTPIMLVHKILSLIFPPILLVFVYMFLTSFCFFYFFVF